MVVDGSLDIDESIQAGGTTGGRAQNFQPLLVNLEESANGNGLISNNGNENEVEFNMALQLGIFDDMGAGAVSDGEVTAGSSFTLDHGFTPRLEIDPGESETNMPPLGSVREEDWEAYDDETRRLLEDCKCPICLDTLINTVKVDCSSGHKFCNYCIQCWIRYERQLVTECPVCRGSIYGRTLDLRTDAEVRGIFERLSDRTKRTRLQAIKERLQLEEQQNSYNGYPFYPQDYHHHQQSTPFRFSNGGGGSSYQDFHYQIPLVSARLSNNGRTERSSYLELAFGGYSVSVGDNNEGETDAAGRPPRPQGQQPRSEVGLVYPSVWDSFLTPTSGTSSNDGSSSRDPFHGNFGAIGDSNEVRYQNYHHHNVDELQSRWNNSLYLSPEESSVNPISNNSSGTIWGGYNYQPVNTSEESVYAGAIGETRNSAGLGFTGGGEGSNASVAPQTSPRMSSLGMNQNHYHHPGEMPASAHSSLPSAPASTSRLSHFVPGFLGGSTDHPSLHQHQQGFTGCGFNNCYTPTCPKHCHFAGPQMPAPARSNNPPVPNHGSCPGVRSANMCYTLPPYSSHPHPGSSSVPANGYFSETAAPQVPPTAAPTTNGPVPANDNTATSPRSHIDDAFGRNRPRSCHTQCRTVPSSAPQTGVYSAPSGGAAAAAGTGQGSNCRYPSQPDVSTCPTLSNGSFFAGGFPLYSPRSGYIGFHISHHNLFPLTEMLLVLHLYLQDESLIRLFHLCL